MQLIQIAFLFFAAIAAGGALMVGLIAAKKPIPGILPIGHGLGGLAALAVLLYALLQMDPAPVRAWWAFGVFATGFAGGVFLFRFVFRNAAPLVMALGHGSLGVIGLYLLYGAAF